MKKDKTYVDAAEFEKRIAASGLPVEEKKGWMRVVGAKGRSVYVPKTKTVGRVDLSWGEHLDIEGTLDLGDARFGSVHSEIDFTRTADEVLATFEACLEAMKALPARAVTRRARHRGPSDAKGWSFMQPAAEQPSAE